MWVALIMALISFLGAKKNGASTSKALLGAAVVGAGTYYVATETDWGKSTLGALDSKIDSWVNPVTGEAVTDQSKLKPLLDAEGNQVFDANGKPLYESTSKKAVQNPDGSWANALIGGVSGTLQSWGGAGTAAVIGTTALATSGDLKKYIPLALAAAAVVIVMK